MSPEMNSLFNRQCFNILFLPLSTFKDRPFPLFTTIGSDVAVVGKSTDNTARVNVSRNLSFTERIALFDVDIEVKTF